MTCPDSPGARSLGASTTTQTAQGTPEAGTVVLPLANYSLNPGNLEIPAGTTVIFRNTDPDPHTVIMKSRQDGALRRRGTRPG